MRDPDAAFWELPPPRGFGEMLKRVRRLELMAGRHAIGLLRGEYLTRIAGHGMDFMEARRYVFGESIRMIDWNMTARMGTPYVKVYQDEREREIFLVLDVSPSMHAGWQDRRKIEYAAELAVSLALSAVASGDRVGYITYAERVIECRPPEKGRAQFFRAARAFYQAAVSRPRPAAVSDMRQAIHEIQGMTGRRFVIFFFSDFIDYDVPDDLRYLQTRHESYLVHLYDPLEYEPSSEVSFPAYSPEGKNRFGAVLPGRAEENAENLRSFLEKEAGKYRMGCVSLSTAAPVKRALFEIMAMMRSYR